MADVELRVSGDIGRLRALAQRFQVAGSKGFRAAVSRRMASTALDLVHEGFQTSTDPYGKSWPPPKTTRRGKPLFKTGRLANSFRGRANATQFTIGSSVAYAPVYHYGGTFTQKTRKGTRRVTLPRRRMAPEGRPGLKWGQAFEEVAGRAIDELFRR